MWQERVVDAIDEHQRQCGHPPSIRELAERLDVRSMSQLHRALVDLRAEGVIAWENGRNRTLRVVGIHERVPAG